MGEYSLDVCNDVEIGWLQQGFDVSRKRRENFVLNPVRGRNYFPESFIKIFTENYNLVQIYLQLLMAPLNWLWQSAQLPVSVRILLHQMPSVMGSLL